VARRWSLYLVTCAAVVGLEALFYSLVHVPFADAYAVLVGEPLLIAVVTVYAGCDARGILPNAGERWSRIVDRAWAVIVVDVGLSFVTTSGLEAMSTAEPTNILLGTLVLFLGAMLVYAEPYICLNDDVPVLSLVPYAIVRSMILAWVNMSRIFSLFALQLAVTVANVYLDQAASHWFKSFAWINMVYWAIVNVPLAALFAVAYLDTLSQERKMVRP
jgi:hypothetical protein